MRTLTSAYTTLILIICANTYAKADTHHHQPRSPQGFQGVRGKRSVNETQGQVELNVDNHRKESALATKKDLVQMYLPALDAGRDQPELTLVKRAPMGFMGMRGKKEYETTDFDQKGPSYYRAQDDDNLYLPKRAPSGFMGMRGKKYYTDNYYYDSDKRAPNGFVGMRGKKENNDILSELQYLEGLNENENDFFDNLQNDRRILAALAQEYAQTDTGGSDGGGLKRAPSSGFFGMRGKRFYGNDGSEDDILSKRAPSAGFFGMRGKKWVDDSDVNGNEEDEFQLGEEKRAPSVGFHGMRGKKDVSNVLDEVNEKRAPSAGFFGMRGKKGPAAGFFGTRGKKGPFEFRGKFVGVRGKKVSAGSLRNFAMNMADLQLPELQSAHLVNSELDANKRAPSGFQGMRGKKWTDSVLDQ